MDLRGGTHLVLDLVDTPEAKVDEQARQGVMRIINDRINQFGVTEPLIIPGGSHRIIVELPGLKDSEEAVRVIKMTAELQFADKNGKVWLTGKDLKDARFIYDRNNKPVVALEFNAQGSKLFAAATEANLGQPLFIVLDQQVVTAPVVRDVIRDGKAVINGIESAEEAQRYAIALRSGALPVKVEVIDQRTVGPTLGQDSIEKSKHAFLMGVIGGIGLYDSVLWHLWLGGRFCSDRVCLVSYVSTGRFACYSHFAGICWIYPLHRYGRGRQCYHI